MQAFDVFLIFQGVLLIAACVLIYFLHKQRQERINRH